MAIEWHNETRRIRDLIPYVANPRQITDKQAKDLKASLDKFGIADPLIINTDNTIIGGHQRKKIMETLLGYDPDYEIDVRVPDRELTIDELRELNVRLNKNVAEWDFDTLANNFELDDLIEWGFVRTDLDLDLWMPDPPEDAEPQIDRAEELREIWGVETGQLWQLGEHRLICGSCTDKDIVERVMGGEKASITFTSPPYNAGKTPTEQKLGTERKYKDYSDDLESDDYLKLLNEFTSISLEYSDFAFVNLQMLSGNKSAFLEYVNIYADRLADIAIWDKQRAQPAMAQNVMNSRFEFLLVIGSLGASRRMPGSFRGTVDNVYGGKPQTDNRLGSGVHAATMPVDFAEWVVGNFATDNVYEPFLGSGTTLIACERLNRKCRAVEISPSYCAVAIQRWVDVTGGEPVLIDED